MSLIHCEANHPANPYLRPSHRVRFIMLPLPQGSVWASSSSRIMGGVMDLAVVLWVQIALKIMESSKFLSCTSSRAPKPNTVISSTIPLMSLTTHTNAGFCGKVRELALDGPYFPVPV